eukprot:gene19220-21148_t
MSTESRRTRQVASSNVANVISGSALSSTTEDASTNESPKDFLQSCGASTLLLDAMSAVLLNRPKDPMAYLSDYFASLIEPKSSFQNAHEKIRSVNYNKGVFESILVDVYQGFKEKRGKKVLSGLRGAEHNELVQYLLKNIPLGLTEQLLKRLMRPEKQSISFSTFRKNVVTALIFEDCIKTATSIYQDLDFGGKGKADKQLCLSFLKELGTLFLDKNKGEEQGINSIKSLIHKHSTIDDISSTKAVMSMDEFVKIAIDNFLKESTT